jgi:hypothetical protein
LRRKNNALAEPPYGPAGTVGRTRHKRHSEPIASCRNRQARGQIGSGKATIFQPFEAFLILALLLDAGCAFACRSITSTVAERPATSRAGSDVPSNA